MLCARCLRVSARRPVVLISTRAYAVVKQKEVDQAKPQQSGGEPPPGATPTPAAQQFSTPLMPAPAKTVKNPNAVVSGTPAGTVMKGINYFKGKLEPVALEDSEYPDWLWTLLDKNKASATTDAEAVGDLYSKSKKERKIAKKRAEKLAAGQSQNTEVRVPISEQTIDLPFTTSPDHQFTRVVSAVGGVGGKAGAKGMRPSMVEIGGEVQVSAEEAIAARKEVKREMRKKSRAAIKEKNFLSTLGR